MEIIVLDDFLKDGILKEKILEKKLMVLIGVNMLIVMF